MNQRDTEFVISALYCARDSYRENADVANQNALPQLAEQFHWQANEAIRIAQALEETI